MLLNLLLGRALMRWLMNLAPEGTSSDRADSTIESDSAPQPEPQPAPEFVYPRVQRHSMGSLFEVYLAGTDREALVAAGESALDEIERLDRQLSHYRDDSDVARLNAHAGKQWVRLEPRLYQLIKRSCELAAETDGAFDITAGPLVKAWGFFRGEGRIPTDDEIAAALGNVGFWRILFDDEEQLVYFTAPNLEINLGAIGKGYAMDEAAAILRFYGVQSAVLHGGGSTIYAVGTPPDSSPRRHQDTKNDEDSTAKTRRREEESSEESGIIRNLQSAIRNEMGWPFEIKDPRDRETVLETVYLKDEAISTSGNYEQFFEVDGVRYSHILDPQTGRPTQGVISVSVIAPSAADSDALSTAFFVMGPKATEEYCRAHPNLRVIMIVERPENEIEVIKTGC